MSLTARIAKNTFVQVVGKVVGLALSLALVAILTRRLGVSNYGDYITALTISQLFAVFADLGVNMYVLKRLSTPHERESRLLGSALGLRLVSLSIMLVPACALSFVLPYARVVQLAILVALVSIAAQTVNSLFVTVLQARLRMQYVAVSDIVGRAVTLALSFLILVWTRSVLAVLAAQVIGALASCLLTYRWARRHVRPRGLWQPSTWMGMLRESLPISASVVLGYIYFKSDMVILSLIPLAGRDNRVEVGIYGTAYKVLEVSILIPSFFMISVFPVLTDFLTRRDARVSKLIDRATGVVTAFGGAAAVGLLVYAPEIIDFIAGPEYGNAVVPLRILSLAVFFSFVASVYTYAALAFNQQLRLVALCAVIAVLNIAANFALIPRYSYVGAAWVAVLTDLSVVAGGVWICRASYPLKIAWASHAVVVVGLAVVGLATWWTRQVSVPLSMLVLLVAFAALSERLKIVTRADVRGLLSSRTALRQSSEPSVPE